MILITGGAGYIGSHVNKMLASLGRETLVLDNLVHGHREFVKWGVFEHVDLDNPDALKKLFSKYPINSVIHFAAYCYVHESMDNPMKYYFNNVAGTLNLLRAMLEHDVQNIIFSSTCAVYGFALEVPLPETHHTAPINPYGRSKLMIENILQDFHAAYGLNHAALRYFNAAGADPDTEIGEWHEPETHLIPLVLDTALGKREKLTVYGDKHDTPDGTCIRDYIHVNDLAKAHILMLEYLEKGGESRAVNLGIGGGYSVREVIEIAEQVSGRPVPFVVGKANPGDPPQLVAAADTVRNLLGWSPEFPKLEQIIGTAWEWHKHLYKHLKH
jgi:UDP-glucose 4-epimerase